MKWERQMKMKEEARQRRIAQRLEVAAFIDGFKKEWGFEPTRTEVAAHFRKSVSWYTNLLLTEEADAKPV